MTRTLQPQDATLDAQDCPYQLSLQFVQRAQLLRVPLKALQLQ
ncbi:hypothetical protein [Variovorax boronicumulans]|nr:hypothetical protein [Variovorax boronicumulans]